MQLQSTSWHEHFADAVAEGTQLLSLKGRQKKGIVSPASSPAQPRGLQLHQGHENVPSVVEAQDSREAGASSPAGTAAEVHTPPAAGTEAAALDTEQGSAPPGAPQTDLQQIFVHGTASNMEFENAG